MINEILRDLINTREVVSLINNAIVRTKEEKGYNKVVARSCKEIRREYTICKRT